MRPDTKTKSLGVIARELALDMADAAYSPDVCEHVPGIANVGADVLSRKFQPDKETWSAPEWLTGVRERRVSLRDDKHFRSLVLPDLDAGALK